MSINVSIVYNTIISRILLWLSDIAVILIIGVTTVVGHNARLEYYTEPLTSSPGSLGPATNGRTVRGETDQWEASVLLQTSRYIQVVCFNSKRC